MKGDRNRSSSSVAASETHQLLRHLGSFHHWWLRSDLLEQGDRFLDEVRHLLQAQDCALYLEGVSASILLLKAHAQKGSTVFPSQLVMPADDALWRRLQEQWLNQQYGEVSATLHAFNPSLDMQASQALIAPLFLPGQVAPLGAMVLLKDLLAEDDGLVLSQIITQ